MSRKPSPTVTLSEYAADWGVSVRTVTNWIAEGMPCRMVDGARRVVRSDANAWQKGKAEEKAPPTNEAEARARKLAAEARLAELELEREEGKVIAAEDVERAWAAMAHDLRAQLLTLPQRWAPGLLGCKGLPDMTARIEAALQEAMAALRDRYADRG